LLAPKFGIIEIHFLLYFKIWDVTGILLRVSFEAAGGVIDSTGCAETLVGYCAIAETSVAGSLFANPAIAAKAAVVCVSAR
jgi:hypothetical protein